MPESQQHMRLVEALVQWIALNYLKGEIGLILSDTAGTGRNSRAREIGGYVPDIYVPLAGEGRIIVGEVKTSSDLENRHTLAQFETFLKYVNQFKGSKFVVGVPWHCVPLTKNILSRLTKINNLEPSSFQVPFGMSG